jgi:catechol 2,3-dioxygenase-like lactoylglutathione lyase family enzyme
MAKVTGLGHVAIYVDDLAKQRDFYTRVLGLRVADEDPDGRGMVFLSADPIAEHHEFVLIKGRVTSAETRVLQQVSFTVSSIEDLRAFKRQVERDGLPVERIVSHGNAFGMYVFDPEGNRVELYFKTGFPVPQPHGDPIDLERSDAELLGEARELLFATR